MEDNLELLRKARESLEMLYATYEEKAKVENIVKVDELLCQVYKGKISGIDRSDITFQNDDCSIVIEADDRDIFTDYLSKIELNKKMVRFAFLDENECLHERLYLLNLIDDIDKIVLPEMQKKLDVMRCLDVIIKYDAIPLKLKFEMIIEFKSFVENIFNTLTKLYDEHSSMYFKYIILENMLKQLEYICNENLLDVDKQVYRYADTSKKLLLDNLRIKGLKEEYKKEFSKHNEVEQKMQLMWLIYKMTQNVFDLKEMGAYFNIPEDELLKSFIHMEFKSEKAIRNLVDESDIGCEYIKKREK
ncbi:hypothetical protein EGR52_11945 [bacterium]|nr:hypothetical protein [bacterium]